VVDFDKVQILSRSVGGSLENPLWAGSDTPYQFDVSRVAELTIHLFIRSPNAAPSSGRSQDICLGVVRLNPQFGANTSLEGAASSGCSGVGWFDMHHGTGQLQLGVSYVVNQTSKLEANDFELLKAVGNGTFGHILQVRKKDTNRIYAMKILRKAYLPSGADVATLVEQSVLAQADNPFIVPLKFSFESPKKLYLVSAFVGGNGLLEHLSKEGRFDVNRCRFYAAELLCAFECLHGFDFMYRDLKPENILLDYQGHIAICDFSLCKLDARGEDSVETCGTPEFLTPEVLLGHGHGTTADWWTLGVLLYEMLTGLPLFYDEATDEMHRKILSEPLHFPDIIPPAAKSLLSKLLNRNPVERLSVNGAAEIKAHPFFNAIDWGKLMRREYEPVFKPNEVCVIGLILRWEATWHQTNSWTFCVLG
jgi:serum/glucocorticoid-regulated kinase 2